MANLIVLGIVGGVYALSGVNLLDILSFGITVLPRVYLAICGVSALFCVYSLIAFKPFKGLK
ncbi:MAG: hypothetical protein K2I20_01325 [Clostridia bacterium]|nr:hypothetical protein [Clostridia bacterium]